MTPECTQIQAQKLDTISMSQVFETLPFMPGPFVGWAVAASLGSPSPGLGALWFLSVALCPGLLPRAMPRRQALRGHFKLQHIPFHLQIIYLYSLSMSECAVNKKTGCRAWDGALVARCACGGIHARLACRGGFPSHWGPLSQSAGRMFCQCGKQ